MKVVASKDCGFMKSLACLLSTFLLITPTFAFARAPSTLLGPTAVS